MVGEIYAIQYAKTQKEILEEVLKFVRYLRSGPVIMLLPEELHELSVRDVEDILAWNNMLDRARAASAPLNATARFWLDEVAQVFGVAGRRLDQLRQTQRAGLETARSPDSPR